MTHTIDISNNPELIRLAEEVRTTKTPRILKKANEPVAILMPVGPSTKSKKKRGKTKADYEAFKSAAGSWKDVDVEQFKKDIYEDRRQTNIRSKVQL